MRVRYEWKVIDVDSLAWEQAFSFDGRRTWDTNWIMESTRIASHVGRPFAVLSRALTA